MVSACVDMYDKPVLVLTIMYSGSCCSLFAAVSPL